MFPEILKKKVLINLEKSKTLDGEKELLIALQIMENNKSPENYGITKEFCMTFWNEVNIRLLLAIEKIYFVKQLIVSQKQSVIKINGKKGSDKYIKNWRPISLLKIGIKLISKVLAERLKNVLPEVINIFKSKCICEKYIYK